MSPAPDAPTLIEDAPPAPPPVAPKPDASVKFASRDDWIGAAGKFAEEEYTIDGIGLVLLSEISGAARADILGTMATALQPDPETKEKGRLDTTAYQRALLLAGVVDPVSPAGDRRPLFRAGDMELVMRVGGAKVQTACEVIERLSKMGRWQTDAEGNSEATRNGASTSG